MGRAGPSRPDVQAARRLLLSCSMLQHCTGHKPSATLKPSAANNHCRVMAASQARGSC